MEEDGPWKNHRRRELKNLLSDSLKHESKYKFKFPAHTDRELRLLVTNWL
jgi:hypothetical protein